MSEDTISLSRVVDSHQDVIADLTALEGLAHHLGGRPGPSALDNLDEAIILLRSRLAALMGTEERAVCPPPVARSGRRLTYRPAARP
jgi:hypothetical protein